jgi:hypothetical protein
MFALGETMYRAALPNFRSSSSDIFLTAFATHQRPRSPAELIALLLLPFAYPRPPRHSLEKGTRIILA